MNVAAVSRTLAAVSMAYRHRKISYRSGGDYLLGVSMGPLQPPAQLHGRVAMQKVEQSVHRMALGDDDARVDGTFFGPDRFRGRAEERNVEGSAPQKRTCSIPLASWRLGGSFQAKPPHSNRRIDSSPPRAAALLAQCVRGCPKTRARARSRARPRGTPAHASAGILQVRASRTKR